MASVPYACHVCQMEFNGPVTYKGHLESSKHQKKVAVQKQLETLSTGGATASSSQHSGTSTGCPRTVHSLVQCTERYNSPLLQADPLRFFYCRLCNITATCQEALTAHNQGWKHQRALDTSRRLQLRPTREAAQPLPLPKVAARTPPTLQVSQPPQGQLEKKSQQKDEVIDLSCRLCGIVLFEDVVSKLEHLETEGHRKKKVLPL
ncbi:hypothetical protein HPB50_028439 [Hyalomma asiaticum]|nr:hypothetical protein HPB50_028439 [Hyalomma asiaticum]